MVSWKCGDSEESHSHTVFGNKIVKEGKIAPVNGEDCKVSLKNALMNEEVFKDVIRIEAWSCFDSTYKKCFIHQEDSCKRCKTDKKWLYLTIIEAWTMLAAVRKPLEDEGYEDCQLPEIISFILSPHKRSFTGLCFPDSWNPARALKLEGNDDISIKRLSRY